MKLSEFGNNSNATNISKLGDHAFTITTVKQHPYEDTPGVKLTTDKVYDIDGKKYSEFYTTRTAIVSFLNRPDVVEKLETGNTIGSVKVVKRISTKTNRGYFVLEDAN